MPNRSATLAVLTALAILQAPMGNAANNDDIDPTITAFVTMPFGGSSTFDATEFGMALQYCPRDPTGLTGYHRYSRLPAAIEARFDHAGLKTFRANGIDMLHQREWLWADGNGLGGVGWIGLAASVAVGWAIIDGAGSGGGGGNNGGGNDDGNEDNVLDGVLDAVDQVVDAVLDLVDSALDLDVSDTVDMVLDTLLDAVTDVADMAVDAVLDTDLGAADVDAVVDGVDAAVDAATDALTGGLTGALTGGGNEATFLPNGDIVTPNNARDYYESDYYGGYGYGEAGG